MLSPRVLIFAVLVALGAAGGIYWNFSRPQRVEGSAKMALSQGENFSRHGQVSGALAAFDKAVQLRPNDPRGYLERGELQEDLNHLADAESDFTHAVQLDAKLCAAYYHRASVYHLEGKNDQAREDFAQAVSCAPADIQAWMRRAAFEAKRQEYEAAESDYTQALTLQPNNLMLYTLRGAVRSMRGDNRGAAEDARRVNGHLGDPEAQTGDPVAPPTAAPSSDPDLPVSSAGPAAAAENQ